MFQALSPGNVNQLSSDIIQVFQGEGPNITALVCPPSGSLTSALAAKDRVIDEVIDNLNSVVTTINSRGNALAQTVTTLQELVSGLAADRQPIGTAISAIGSLTSATAGLLQVGRAPLTPGHRPARPPGHQPGANNSRPTVQTRPFLQEPAGQDDRHRPAGLLRILAQLLPLQRHGDRRPDRPARHEAARRRPGHRLTVHVMRGISLRGIDRRSFGLPARGERRPLKPLKERNPIAVGLAGLALLVVVALLAFNANNLPIIGGGTTYSALFTEDAGLQPGNEVRIAGVTVGKVTGVSLAGAKVAVTFKVKNAWVGDRTTVAIDIKTVLGDKYLALDPLGPAQQNPGAPIPLSRTTSPYDVTQAFQGFGQEVSQLNTVQLGKSLKTLSGAFSGTPPYVHRALTGLSALSQTIASKDVQLARLFAGTRQITQTLSSEDSEFRALLGDGNLLLGELRQRQQAIHAMLTGTEALATQLSGLVSDNQATLGPTLRSLDQVTTVLKDNQANLRKALALAGPYYSLLGNTLGNGRWFDTYLCGLVPKSYSPPGTGPATGCEPPKPGGPGDDDECATG